jgi:hypothetical protein
LLKIFFIDATFKSVGDVNNIYALKKKAVLVVRIIGNGGSLKKSAKFLTLIAFFGVHCVYGSKVLL